MKSVTVVPLSRNGSSPALLANQPRQPQQIVNRVTIRHGNPSTPLSRSANTTPPLSSSQPHPRPTGACRGSNTTPPSTPVVSLRAPSSSVRQRQPGYASNVSQSTSSSPTLAISLCPDGDDTSSADDTETSSQISTTIPRLIVEETDIPPNNCFRLVLLGSARVGKTSLAARFLGNRFSDAYTPTIEDFHRKLYRIRGETYRLDILDTSGNDPFPAMRRLSLLTGDLFLVIYGIDSRDSFDEARRLQEQVFTAKAGQQGQLLGASNATGSGSGSGASGSNRNLISAIKSSKHGHHPHVPMVIVGNKCDREFERAVDPGELKAAADLYPGSCAGIEASAKKNSNVDEVFVKLFLLARLPTEMSPSQHRKIQPSTYLGVPGDGGGPYGSSSGGGRGGGGSGTDSTSLSSGGSASPRSVRRRMVSLRRRLSDACGAVAINARRPSIRTDLLALQQNRRTMLSPSPNQVQLDSNGSTDSSTSGRGGDFVRGGLDMAAKCCIQ